MPNLTLYQQPVLLHRDTHRKLRLAPLAANFSFAAGAHSLPLTGVEFGEACKDYPIVFAKDASAKVAPVLALGLREGENLFVDETGRWSAEYLPAFVRRYPFVLADLPDGKLGACIDQACTGLGDAGEALFDEQGNTTPFLQNALDFLNRFQAEYARTERFCQRLVELDLLTSMNAKAELADGGTFTIAGMLVVDERKLLELPEAKALEIFRAGELAWVYAHLLSMSNVRRLSERLAARRQAAASGSLPN